MKMIYLFYPFLFPLFHHVNILLYDPVIFHHIFLHHDMVEENQDSLYVGILLDDEDHRAFYKNPSMNTVLHVCGSWVR